MASQAFFCLDFFFLFHQGKRKKTRTLHYSFSKKRPLSPPKHHIKTINPYSTARQKCVQRVTCPHNGITSVFCLDFLFLFHLEKRKKTRTLLLTFFLNLNQFNLPTLFSKGFNLVTTFSPLSKLQSNRRNQRETGD